MGSGTSPGGLLVRRTDDRLESWKEIAVYLGRDERTVRRWEKQEGLPVRRHVHQRQSSVYAYKSELDAWRQSRGVAPQNNHSSPSPQRRIDWLRVVLGGALWSVAYNVLTGAGWFLLLRRTGLSSFHPLLGSSSPPDFTRAASFILLTLAMGLSGMWFYAGMRSRYGAGRLTAVYAGLTLWWLWGLMPMLPDIGMRTLPGGPLTLELGSKMVVILLATLAGAWVYRNPAADQRQASQTAAPSPPTSSPAAY